MLTYHLHQAQEIDNNNNKKVKSEDLFHILQLPLLLGGSQEAHCCAVL